MPSKNWWLQKFNGPGITYELGISIYQNQLVWITGPHKPRGGQDLENFWAPDGFKSKIPQGKKVIADTIYRDPVCTIQNPLDTPEVWRFKQQAQSLLVESQEVRVNYFCKWTDHQLEGSISCSYCNLDVSL